MSALVSASPAELLTREEAAAYIGVSAQTLAVWYALPFIKIGSRVRYRRSDLDAWRLARSAAPTQKIRADSE